MRNTVHALMFVVCSAGCVSEYHPEYHPVSIVSVHPSVRERAAPPERVIAFENPPPRVAREVQQSPAVPEPPNVTVVDVVSDDPLHGRFTLADATQGLPAGDALTVTLDINEPGTHVTCRLLPDKAPLTVANFVGLARGLRPWKDRTGHWVTKAAYNHTTLHWVSPQGYIHGGDVNGDAGDAGYVIPDENPGAHHDHAGQLCMANRGPNTNSAQFFITTHAASHLDGGYTVFGECGPTTTVQSWLNMDSTVEIEKATFRRTAWEAP